MICWAQSASVKQFLYWAGRSLLSCTLQVKRWLVITAPVSNSTKNCPMFFGTQMTLTARFATWLEITLTSKSWEQIKQPSWVTQAGIQLNLIPNTVFPIRLTAPLIKITELLGVSVEQMLLAVEVPTLQVHPISTLQSLLHPSPFIVLVSSHSSVSTRRPSPQMLIHAESVWPPKLINQSWNPSEHDWQLFKEVHDLQYSLQPWQLVPSRQVPMGQGPVPLVQQPPERVYVISRQLVHWFAALPKHVPQVLWHASHLSLVPKYPLLQKQSCPLQLVLMSQVRHTPAILQYLETHAHAVPFHSSLLEQVLHTPLIKYWPGITHVHVRVDRSN